MTVKQIVKEYLTANGYDGLFSDYWECNCSLSDLMPCGLDSETCEAGYSVPCGRGVNITWTR
jgi:hypothetical protein